MEELPDYKKVKGILDRSFIFRFVVGDVEYNIKDIMNYAGDLSLKPLHDELIDTRKLLFAFRLIHHGDVVPDLRLNIRHRSEELTKPCLRLFSSQMSDALTTEVIDEVRLALSKFIAERNELKKNSLESKLYDAVKILVEKQELRTIDEYAELEPYAFYNIDIYQEVKSVMNGQEIPYKPNSFYTVEHGPISHKIITGLYKSKFKADSFKTGSGAETKRGLKFSREYLDRLSIYYEVPNEIVILQNNTTKADNQSKQSNIHNNATENDRATYATLATDSGEGHNKLNKEITRKTIESDTQNSVINTGNISHVNDKLGNTNCDSTGIDVGIGTSVRPRSVASVASVAEVKQSRMGSQKAQELGLLEIPCLFCSKYKDYSEFRLSLHLLEYHKPDLFKLPIGRGSMDWRADYAVGLAKKKMAEQFRDEDNEGTDERVDTVNGYD